jgi:phosphatidylglycerophosphate synthase
MNILLLDTEKDKISKWKYIVDDKSLTSYYLDPYYFKLIKYIPSNISPNVLSILGFLCTMFSFNLNYYYFESNESFVCISIAILIFLYMLFDAIDGKHARATNNSSPVGELLDHTSDNIGTVFLMLNLCTVIGINDIITKWYVVQSGLLIFLESHIRAYKTRIVEFGKYNGPSEFLLTLIVLCLLRAMFTINLNTIFTYIAYYVYHGAFIYILYSLIPIKNYNIKIPAYIIMTLLLIPNIMIHANLMSNISIPDIIGNGVILSIFTSEIIICKMASKDINPIIMIFILLSLFNSYLSILLTAIYHIGIFIEIAFYMKIPLIRSNVKYDHQ